MKKNQMMTVAIVILAIIVANDAWARDLGAAATSAVNQAKIVARSASVLGVLVGGVLMQIPGAVDFGKRTLTGGLIGCACSFGGPAFVATIQNIFGN